MIQFQQVPAALKSDSLVDLIEAKRAEELDQIQAEYRRRKDERYSIEQQLKAEELKLDASRRFAHQSTFVGVNTVGFGVVAFLLRIAFVNAGFIPGGVVIAVLGLISLVLSILPVVGAVVGWRQLWRGHKRFRALKDRLKGGRQ